MPGQVVVKRTLGQAAKAWLSHYRRMKRAYIGTQQAQRTFARTVTRADIRSGRVEKFRRRMAGQAARRKGRN